jgi:hypothetical protein
LAQTKAPHSSAVPASSEQRIELGLQTARQNPLQLRHFLLGMPKGADLHNHLSGAVYAESWIRAAAEDHLCVDIAKLAFAKPQGSSSSGTEQPCGEGKVPAADAYKTSISLTHSWMHSPCAGLCLRQERRRTIIFSTRFQNLAVPITAISANGSTKSPLGLPHRMNSIS